MLSADRESKLGGERFAIPTQGEVEGKLLVCELVAVVCLNELLKTQHASVVQKIRRRILEDLKDHCQSLKLCAEDEKATAEYAAQILKATVNKAHAKP